jgi:uridine kinase
MIQKIKDEIENHLNITDYTSLNFSLIVDNLSKLLQNHVNQKNIYDFKVNCDETNNPSLSEKYIKIDIYVQEHRWSTIIHLNIIYVESKIKALRKLRKKKLEQLYGSQENR